MPLIRQATPFDAAVVAHHRSAMFHDMGVLPPELVADLEAATMQYLARALPLGEYRGWLASPPTDPDRVVAGAGVQLRQVLPFPRSDSGAASVAKGRQAIVLNVYTEPAWRRRGLARALMERVIEWARLEELDSLVLHASDDGRRLYQELGFVATNEMRFAEPLAGP